MRFASISNQAIILYFVSLSMLVTSILVNSAPCGRVAHPVFNTELYSAITAASVGSLLPLKLLSL